MAPSCAVISFLLLFFLFFFLFLVDTAFGENNDCGWAVDYCERSEEDATCNVHLRRWCPCAFNSNKRSCKCRKRRCSKESAVVNNVTEARDMIATKLRFASKLESFCDLKNCTTYERKCPRIGYYSRLHGNSFYRKCCFYTEDNIYKSVICGHFARDKWCYLQLCGYHPQQKPKPTPKPVIPSNWSPWTENDLPIFNQGSDDDTEEDYAGHGFGGWPYVLLLFLAPCLVCCCKCTLVSKKRNAETTTNTVDNTVRLKELEERPLTVTVREPLHPEPGIPLPASRLPDHLKETLPDSMAGSELLKPE